MTPPGGGREWDGYYLDGRTAVRQPVRVRLMGTGLEIVTEGGATFWWPYGEIRQTQGFYRGEHVRLERGGEPAEALLLPDVAVLDTLQRVAPEAARKFHDPARRRRRVPLVLLATLAVIGLTGAIYVWGIPLLASALAARVPASWEERLGRAVVEELAPASRRCGGAGTRALDVIVTRLAAVVPESPYTIRVIVLDQAAVNAFATPGGHIVLHRGLIEQAGSPEEIAGVLAHEVQHVLRRHVTRALFQQASTGLLVTALTGDVSGIVVFGVEAARKLGALRYSRQAEEEADAEGLRMLRAARIDSAGMIRFFESLRRREGELLSALGYLSTHPSTEERIARLRALAAEPAPSPAPLLAPDAWLELRAVCQRAVGATSVPAGCPACRRQGPSAGFAGATIRGAGFGGGVPTPPPIY